jgi:hypothetical protein
MRWISRCFSPTGTREIFWSKTARFRDEKMRFEEDWREVPYTARADGYFSDISPAIIFIEGFLYREPNACNCGARKRIELDAFSMPSPDLKQHQPNDSPEVGDTEDEQG